MLVLGLTQLQQLLELDDARPQRLELLLEGGGVLVLGLTQLQQLLELDDARLSDSSSCSRAVRCADAFGRVSAARSLLARALSDARPQRSSSCSRAVACSCSA